MSYDPHKIYDLHEIFKKSKLMCKHQGVHGDWRIDNKRCKLHLVDIVHLINQNDIYTLNHEDIAWGMSARPPKGNFRYKHCDISYPCIVARDAPNPYGKKFRLLDGAHRMSKMMDMGITKSNFYILEFAEIRQFYRPEKEKYRDPI